MARINWKDRIVERPRTFNKVENPDGTITLEPAPGQIIQEGTPVNAKNLNGLGEEYDNFKAETMQDIEDFKTIISDDVEMNSSGIKQLYREIANLKLYQEATQRIENGIVFGDNFIGEPMQLTYSDFTDSFRDTDGIYMTKGHIFNNLSPYIKGSGSDSAATITPKGEGFILHTRRDSNKQELNLVFTEPIDVGEFDYLEMEFSKAQYPWAYLNVHTNQTIRWLDGNYTKRTGNLSHSSYVEGEKRTARLDLNGLSGLMYVGVTLYAYDYLATKDVEIFSIKAVSLRNSSSVTFNLPNADSIVVYVEKSGDFNINGYADGQLMDKELVGNEYEFTKNFPTKRPVSVKLDLDRTVLNETDKITRILGGVSK